MTIKEAVDNLSALGDYGIIHGGNLSRRVVASKITETPEKEYTSDYANETVLHSI